MTLLDVGVEVGATVGTSPAVVLDIGVEITTDVTVTTTGAQRRTVLVDQDGTPYDDGFLDTAVHGDITWIPSGTATWSFTMPATDDKVDTVLGAVAANDYGIGEPLREVQLWRGDRVVSWGPAVSPRVDGNVLEVAGNDVGFYFDKRTIGPGVRPNLLDDPELANGISSWSVLVTSPPYTFTTQNANASVSFSYAWGHRAIKIVNTTADDSFSEPQAIQFHQYGAYAWPHRWTFSATMWVESWTGPNPRKSGIGLAVLPADWTNLYTDARAVAWATVDETFSREGPQRLSVSIDAGNAVGGYVVPIITGPKGTSYIYDLDLDMEGGLEFSGEDQGAIATKVTDHITGNTDSAYERAIAGLLSPYSTKQDSQKSNIKVAAVTTIDGQPRSRRYFYGQGITGSSALQEFAQLDDGFEYDFLYTSTTRTMRTHHPRLGTYRAKCPIRYTAAGGNVLSYSWSFEGGQAANQVSVTGAGDIGFNRYGQDMGAGRPYATASDASSFADGTTIEQSVNAPADVRDWQLGGVADKRLTQTVRPVTLQVRIPASPYFDNGLWVGDRVPVKIVHGSFGVDDIMRITRMTLTADDYLDLTLSPWDGGTS